MKVKLNMETHINTVRLGNKYTAYTYWNELHLTLYYTLCAYSTIHVMLNLSIVKNTRQNIIITIRGIL